VRLTRHTRTVGDGDEDDEMPFEFVDDDVEIDLATL
jgi:hypothetical protein